MSALVDAYEHPTAALSAETAMEAVARQAAVAMTMDRLTSAFPEVEEAIAQGLFSDGESEPLGNGSSDREPLNVTGSGYLEVTRICPGFEPDEGPRDENGTIQLTVGFTEAGVDPVVWGSLRACRFVLGGERMTLEGDIQVHVGENLQFDGFGDAPVLVHIAGALDTNGFQEGLDEDFRVLPDGRVEYRLAIDGGHLIYWEHITLRGLRAKNGDFTCDFEETRCSDASGTSFDW